MNNAYKTWMAQNPRVEGVLARGVRLPDKTTLNESYSKDFPLAVLDNVWRSVADAYQVFTMHRLPTVRMRWVYEKALVQCVRRNDGVILGLFTSPNRDQVDVEGLERLFASFEALPGSRSEGGRAARTIG